MRQKGLLTLFVVGVILLMAAYMVQSPAQLVAPAAGVQVEAQAPEEPTSTATEESKALVRRLQEEVFQDGNMELVNELVAADYVLHQPGSDQGREEYFGQELPAFRTAFPDLEFTFEHRIAEDNLVATRFIISGTHQAEFMGIPATGNAVSIFGIVFDRVEGGQVAESWVVMDRLGMMQQLGVMEQVEEPQQPTGIADLVGVWSRPKPGYPKPGKYLWQVNPDGIDQMSREETVAGKVVKLSDEVSLRNQWSVEGTEWQAVTIFGLSDAVDIDIGCSVSGRYEIQPAEGDGIQFILIDDKCGPRREVLTGGVWHREAGGE